MVSGTSSCPPKKMSLRQRDTSHLHATMKAAWAASSARSGVRQHAAEGREREREEGGGSSTFINELPKTGKPRRVASHRSRHRAEPRRAASTVTRPHRGRWSRCRCPRTRPRRRSGSAAWIKGGPSLVRARACAFSHQGSPCWHPAASAWFFLFFYFIIVTAVRARNNGNDTPFCWLVLLTRVTWNGTDGRQAFQRFLGGVCCPLGVKGVGVRGGSPGCLRTAGALRGARDDMHMAHGCLLQSYRHPGERTIKHYRL